MKSREELLRAFANSPEGLADYALGLQEQIDQATRQLAQRERELAHREQELTHKEQQLAEAQAVIAELKQQLFGAKSEKLTPEQEEQLQEVVGDLQDQAQRPPPLSQEVLQEALRKEGKEERKRSKERRRRNLPPVQLEKKTVVLEPEEKICPTSGKQRPRIGQEVSTEYDFVPAKLIILQTVRPKYGACDQDCCSGVKIAPLPPRLVPQSKLGLGTFRSGHPTPTDGSMGGEDRPLTVGHLLADLGGTQSQWVFAGG
jgi:hypothetical protein